MKKPKVVVIGGGIVGLVKQSRYSWIEVEEVPHFVGNIGSDDLALTVFQPELKHSLTTASERKRQTDNSGLFELLAY